MLAGAGADTIDPNAKLSYTSEVQAGVEREIAPNTGLTVRYTYKWIGRVLEDVANAPMVAYDLGVPGLSSVEYILTNPTSSTLLLPGAAFLGAKFDDPVHRYQAVEAILTRRFSKNWSMLGSYRWSRLRGNFEGFYRDDNGQSDPAFTSLYDFPTNDPSYATIGASQFGYRGDIRFLGAAGEGPLPLDRPHDIKLYGTYIFPFGLSASMGLQVTSGKPLTALAANPNPNYQNGGEIPLTPRGAGFQTSEGFKTRTPFTKLLNGQASYNIRFGNRGLVLLADVFNVMNRREALNYDNWTQRSFSGGENLNFGQPVNGGNSSFPAFQTPRQVRLGARFEW